MFYRAIKTCTFIAATVLAQQAQASNDYFQHLEESDKKLLKLMEERCFEPQYLMSFPDGFTSREHSHACQVAAFFKPSEYQSAARNLALASRGYEGFNFNEAKLLAEYKSIDDNSAIMKRILDRDALLLLLTPKSSLTKFDRQSLNRVAGPNFFEMLVEPHMLDHKYTIDGLRDLTRRIVDSSYLMSDHYLQEAINNLSIAIGVFQLSPDFEKNYYTKHGFGLSLDHSFAKDLLVLSKLSDSNLFDEESFFNVPIAVLNIRLSGSRDILGSSRASQVDLIDSFGNSADLSIIYHFESLRRWLAGIVGFESPFENLRTLQWYADNGFNEVLAEYLIYFPTVSSSNLLQIDFEQYIQTLADVFDDKSFGQLRGSTKRLFQALITSSIYSPISLQLWAEIYENRNVVWPFRKEMFDNEVIEWWESHTNQLVVFVAKQEALNPDFDWSEADINKLAKSISNRAKTLCQGFSKPDCELLLNHVNQFKLLGGGKDPFETGKRLLQLGGINSYDEQENMDFEALNKVKMCHVPEAIEGLYLRALNEGNMNSLFRTKCTKQDYLGWLNYTESEFYPWIIRSIIRSDGLELVSNSWLNGTGLGLFSTHIFKYAPDPRLIDTPSEYHNTVGFHAENIFHEPYENALGNRPLSSFDQDEKHMNEDDLDGLSGFFHEIGLVERALLALVQHKSALEKSEFNFPQAKEEYQFSLRAAARQTGLPSSIATKLAYDLEIEPFQTLSNQQTLEFFTAFAGTEELGRRLMDEIPIPPIPEELDEKKVMEAIRTAKNQTNYIEIWQYLLGLEESDFQYICSKLLTEIYTSEDFLALMSNPQFIRAKDKITEAFGWVEARTTYCGRQIFNAAANDYLGENSSFDKGSNLLDLYLETSASKNLGKFTRLTSHSSLERIKSLADFGSMRISVVAPVIALYGLKEITEKTKLMFLRRDSRNFRRIQPSLEHLITSLLTTFSDEEFRKVLGQEKSAQLLDLAYEIQINFHEPMVSAKSRDRAIVGDGEKSEELSRTIKSRYKRLTDADSLDDFILKLASIGENLPSIEVNLYPNNREMFYDKELLKSLPQSSGIFDLMYSDGVIKGYLVTTSGPSLINYEFDPELINVAQSEIKNTGSLSRSSMDSLCVEAEKQGTYQSFAKYQTLIIVPSVNLLPIPHDLLFGDICQNSAKRSVYASSLGAGLELLLNPTLEKAESETIIAMGDPRPAQENNFISFLSPNFAKTRSETKVPNIYPPLPNAASEVQSISDMFPFKSVHLGTEGSLRQALKTAEEMAKKGRDPYLLIATHGIEPRISETAVLPSLLSSESASLELVSTAEIYGTELAGAIVSLSACQTASGLTNDPGQHLSGFPTAFADAGAKLIIASLWNVNDATSKRFSEAFFLSLQSIKSFLEASRAARQAVSPIDSAPYVFIYP